MSYFADSISALRDAIWATNSESLGSGLKMDWTVGSFANALRGDWSSLIRMEPDAENCDRPADDDLKERGDAKLMI